MRDNHYIGSELDIFKHALRWKKYWSSIIKPYVTGDVLEVGAGQGNNFSSLIGPGCNSWTALEPDKTLLQSFPQCESVPENLHLEMICGDIETICSNQNKFRFDCIIYIDVLEHIPDDAMEFQRSSSLLNPGGYLVVLSPAFQSLYSPFDKSVGHFRRYEKSNLKELNDTELELIKITYLDSVGFLLSLANRFILKQSMPKLSQIKFWDNWVIPCSKAVDPLVGYSFGRSVLGIWKKLDG